MYGYIYKTTDLTNGKIYIGKRVSHKFIPSYLGSGVDIKDAIQQKGRENFIVEFLIPCFSKKELCAEERFLISYFDARNPNIGYNRALGGEGIGLSGEDHPMYGKYGSLHPNYGKHYNVGEDNYWSSHTHPMKGKKLSEDTRAKMSLAQLGNSHALGYTQTPGHRSKISESLKSNHGDVSGSNNKAFYKKVPITNGQENKLIDQSDYDYYIQNGWTKGRIIHRICTNCGEEFTCRGGRPKLCNKCKEVII